MRKNIAAGNWKMNTSLEEGMQLASEVIHMSADEVNTDVEMILIVPFTHLTNIKKQIGTKNNIFLGAQNCHQEKSGAFTGEISAGMLSAVGVDYVVLGHSERREFFNENEVLLAKKVDAVLAAGMLPIYCCGEKLETREKNGHFDLVAKQVAGGLFHLGAGDFSKVVIAYEPVWAIGTGVTASDDQAQEMHAFIREKIAEKYGTEIAQNTSILYGGSVKPGNAKSLFACTDVDGGLVGGASLQSRDFVEIAKSF